MLSCARVRRRRRPGHPSPPARMARTRAPITQWFTPPHISCSSAAACSSVDMARTLPGHRTSAQRTWPSPVTTYFVDVSSVSPIGPRACSFWVRDADLGAEPELAAVGEPGGRVDHDRGRVDLRGEPPGRGQVGRDDRLGVAGRPARMCSIAASRSGTTAAAMSRSRYSVAQSSSVAATHAVVRREGRVAVDRHAGRLQRVDQPGQEARRRRPRGRAASRRRCRRWCAGSWSSPRCRRPSRGRPSASTYTWQLPTPVSITGTVDSSTTERIRPAPPRGMSTSTSPRARIRALTLSWLSPGTSWTASAGSPNTSTAPRITSTSASLLLARTRRAAQQHRVARLQADAGGVDGDVGPGLVDHPDHPERHADLAQLQPVGQRVAAHHLADRVGQRDELPGARRPWRRSGRCRG